MKKYRGTWTSLTMGNTVDTFCDVLKQVWENLIKYHKLDIKWKYDKNGFYLPKFVYVYATPYVHAEWDKLNDYGKIEAIRNYLMKTHRNYYCESFEYKETEGILRITNIIWDEEE